MSSPLDEARARRSADQLLAEVYRRADRHRRRRRRLTTGIAVAALVVAGTLPVAVSLAARGVVRAGATTGTTEPGPRPTLPDGAPAWIVGTRDTDVQNLSLLATDGSGLVRTIAVPDHRSREGGPVPTTDVQVSTDGHTIYYRAERGGCGSDEVAAVPVDGGPTRSVVRAGDGPGVLAYALSADGASLAMVRPRDCRSGLVTAVDVVLRDLATGDERTIATGDGVYASAGPTTAARRVSFSPDGRRVAFEATAQEQWETEVRVVDLATNAVHVVPAPSGCRYDQPQFVRGSGRLAVHEDCQPLAELDGLDRIHQLTWWLGHANVGGRVVLVDPVTGGVERVVIAVPEQDRVPAFAFDASGRHVLYEHGVRFYGGYETGVYRLSLADGVSRRLYPPADTTLPPPRPLLTASFSSW
jgi:hypothetical protein